MIGLISLLLLFIVPFFQRALNSRRLKGELKISLLVITLLMMISQVATTLGALFVYASQYSENDRPYCDFVTPVFILFGLIITLLIIPLIGIRAAYKRNVLLKTSVID